MKKFFFLAVLLTMCVFTWAQAGFNWTFELAGKQVAHFVKEDPAGNVVVLTTAQLSKKSSLRVVCENTDSAWTRWIMITDSLGNNLVERIDARHCDGEKELAYCVSGKELRKLLETHGGYVKLYTIAVPADPAMAAAVRVRRVPVANIRLK